MTFGGLFISRDVNSQKLVKYLQGFRTEVCTMRFGGIRSCDIYSNEATHHLKHFGRAVICAPGKGEMPCARRSQSGDPEWNPSAKKLGGRSSVPVGLLAIRKRKIEKVPHEFAVG